MRAIKFSILLALFTAAPSLLAQFTVGGMMGGMSGMSGLQGMGMGGMPSMGGMGSPKYRQSGPAGMFQNPLALESHLGHFKHGASHTEGLMNLDRVPDGSLYIALPVKHQNSPTVETRAIAITDLELAAELARAVRGPALIHI